MEHILQSRLGVIIFILALSFSLFLLWGGTVLQQNVISFLQPGQSRVFTMVTSQYCCTFSPLLPPVQRRIGLQSILGEEHKLLTSNTGRKNRIQFELNTVSEDDMRVFVALHHYIRNSNHKRTKPILTMSISVPHIHRESGKVPQTCPAFFRMPESGIPSNYRPSF